MPCDEVNCDGTWVTEPPLQEGGLCSVYQCPICAAQSRRESAERDQRLEEMRRAGRAAGNMWAALYSDE